ncbi:hypothetical protein XENTR_v10002838 [Xenopus tropicalis]|uniref:WD repeat-containing protein 41 n=1 Tax=Xenopus tropicalis TaxID=8364 RepID=A0A8J0PI03_XENTR|nr:WD repeat-containing protein 41 [Xenopus tropicalis]KAE8636099.1 hypothetical protein XENTR_v10002838 [Xenopus tropicalis]|eukprot:NP_001016529.1 WD repeat-containing protein 41 [Xenopus tropicalis]
MLRWLLGSREAHNGVEKSAVVDIGEEQTQNPYTELSVLQGHNDIVRFLLQIDESRFASACDDGSVFIWDVQTGDILCELRGHTQKITAIVAWGASDILQGKTDIILTASSDKTVIAWDCDSVQQVQKATDFHSTVKTLLVLQSLDVWLSGGNELRVWNREFNLLCETGYFVDGGISSLIELPKNCVAAAIGKDLIIFKLSVASRESDQWDVSEVRCLTAHQDIIRSLITVNDLTFVSGSHAGELIVWDALDWTFKAVERNFSEILSPQDAPQEIKLLQTPEEISVQHLASDEEVGKTESQV